MKPTASTPSAPPRRRAAPRSPTDAPRLGCLFSFEAYQAANPHLFPSLQSLRWFYRTNRQELVDAGAVVEVAGGSQVNVPVFDGMVLSIGRRNAAARVEAGA